MKIVRAIMFWDLTGLETFRNAGIYKAFIHEENKTPDYTFPKIIFLSIKLTNMEEAIIINILMHTVIKITCGQRTMYLITGITSSNSERAQMCISNATIKFFI